MKVRIEIGDITETEADCIVNAANPALARGAGVCGAIFAAAGEELDEYIRQNEWHGCPTGGAVITPAFGDLLDRGITKIIHTVGPDMRIVEELALGADLLMMAYASCIEKAIENEVKTIAFPAISTGIYGFDPQLAAQVAVSSAMACNDIEDAPSIVFVCFDQATADFYTKLMTIAQNFMEAQSE